ncbi:hypothetical protein V2J09_000817 [Rumex salicifolius]
MVNSIASVLRHYSDIIVVVWLFLNLTVFWLFVKGNAIQCSVRSNISHCFVSKLIEGNVYSIKNFSVVPNKDKFLIRDSDPMMIELEGYTVVIKLSCTLDVFDRFPFQLVPLEEIRANDSTYLIGEIYLSSTTATSLFKAIDIPQISTLHVIMKTSNPNPRIHISTSPAISTGTLSQLLEMGREQKESSHRVLTSS